MEPTKEDIAKDNLTVRGKLADMGIKAPSLSRSGSAESDISRSQMDESFLLLPPGAHAGQMSPPPPRKPPVSLRSTTDPIDSKLGYSVIPPPDTQVPSVPDGTNGVDWRSYLPSGWGNVMSPLSLVGGLQEAAGIAYKPNDTLKAAPKASLSWNDQSMVLPSAAATATVRPVKISSISDASIDTDSTDKLRDVIATLRKYRIPVVVVACMGYILVDGHQEAKTTGYRPRTSG